MRPAALTFPSDPEAEPEYWGRLCKNEADNNVT